MFVAGHGHFLRTAASLQWDEAAVDLSADADAWPDLEPDLRDRLERLIAGFCVAEAAVAEEIVPFARAAEDPDIGACFGVQAVDEERHARFFDRVGRELLDLRGESAPERRAALATVLQPGFVELFEVRLPATARALGSESSPGALAGAVALYHLVLEGIVFTAGQAALGVLLERADPPLPGLRRGVDLVLADERWHIGFGTRLLEELGTEAETLERLQGEAAAAAVVWGDAVDDEVIERALLLHGRRLRAAGLIRRRATA